MSIPLKGDDDDTILNNYNRNIAGRTTCQEALNIDGGNVQLAGLQPLASELTGTIGNDQQRVRGAGAAAGGGRAVLRVRRRGRGRLPVIVGGLTIAGALGIMRLVAEFVPVHFFAQPVVTLIGLGIAIDYGLFVVSRFREEIAEGYDTEAAVRRTVMTAGRTVTFSAVIIVASSLPLLLFPQGFLKSHHLRDHRLGHARGDPVDHRACRPAWPSWAANVDALGVRTLLRVPFLRNWKPMRASI